MLNLNDLFQMFTRTGAVPDEKGEFTMGPAQMQMLSTMMNEELEPKIGVHSKKWVDHWTGWSGNWSEHD